MSKIIVFKNDTDIKLGKGDGTIDKKSNTITITKWEEKAAVVVGSKYKLKTGGTIYAGAICQNNDLPVVFNL